MAKDNFTKNWIIERSLKIVSKYDDGVLTLRGLYYQLISQYGMTNSIPHYKRVVNAMIEARRAGLIPYETFSDRDREMESVTQWLPTNVAEAVDEAKDAINSWMNYYSKNRWENQDYYVEVLIEKKALIGTFLGPCSRHRVALGACKGYPSLTFLNDVAQRMIEAERNDKIPLIIYFGDYDPSGEDIPRSIQENLENDFNVTVEVRRMALMEEQVLKWKLPPAPAKITDSRTANWDGLGQVELDAVSPERLEALVDEAIAQVFDEDKLVELRDLEREESKEYVLQLKEYVNSLSSE